MDKEQAGELGNYLRQRRLAEGLTLREVGLRAGIDQGDLSKLERGIRSGERSPDKLRAITKVIHGDVELVLTMAGHLPARTDRQRRESERAIERAVLEDPTLTSEQKAYLLQTIDYVRQATDVTKRRADAART
jgi:transcriptional regulator with XRE-family HTH domain